MTRSELYSAIWSAPMQVVSQSLGVSDTGLAKICKKANVPAPYRGYWRRLKTGHSPDVPPLPDPENDAIVVAPFKVRSDPAVGAKKMHGLQTSSPLAAKRANNDGQRTKSLPALNGTTEYKRLIDQLDRCRAIDELMTNLTSQLPQESERVRHVAAAWIEMISAERQSAHLGHQLLREFREVAAGRKSVHWWTD